MKIAIKCLILLSLGISLFAQNQVILLDGIDDYIDLPYPIIDTDKFSIEAWVKMNGPGGGIETQSAIFEQREDATGCNHSTIVFVAESRSYDQYESLAIRTDIECYVACRAESPPYGNWHHYACVVDDYVIYIYLDGMLRNSLDYEHEGSFSTNIDHVSLGKHTHDWAGFGYLNGAMDEVRIWGVPLSQYKILSLMNTPSLTGEEGDLLAYWNFNDSTATDITGHGNDGIFMSGATCAVDSIARPCTGVVGDLNLDGYLSISDIQILIQYILEGTEPIFDLECVDYNGDGYINIGEVIILTDFLLNG
ncbi:MAG: hypothetical protein H8E26_01700 [FCB group bacterium]|nr:hypothetical protein [FCB group bacterium]MBL7029416.1 hypothetical protein [Candidatus Neomarinimicrobiota bacterium]MBL7123199.1 hypothetical protein [Candidatus Neomarinimicrobiota bacterium]